MVFSLLGLSIVWSQGRTLPVGIGALFLLAVGVIRYFHFSRSWDDLLRKVDRLAGERRLLRYALLQAQILELEVELCTEEGDFWRVFDHTMLRVGFVKDGEAPAVVPVQLKYNGNVPLTLHVPTTPQRRSEEHPARMAADRGMLSSGLRESADEMAFLGPATSAFSCGFSRSRRAFLDSPGLNKDWSAVRRRVRRSSGSPEAPQKPRKAGGVPWGALAIFALSITAAPLAFGAVDRVVQIALLGLLAIGLCLHPPQLAGLSRWMKFALLALAVILIAKEFAPAAFFGATHWRSSLTQGYEMKFPWTHHPEPGRAVDGLLAGGLAVLWFLWVRSLAAVRENRPWMAWSIFIAAALVAAVSFATRGLDAHAIYGLRYTPEWRGFGPDHQSHGLLPRHGRGGGLRLPHLGRGAQEIHPARRGHRPARFEFRRPCSRPQSRGGLLAFAAGLAIYLGLTLAHLRSRSALAGVMRRLPRVGGARPRLRITRPRALLRLRIAKAPIPCGSASGTMPPACGATLRFLGMA